MFNAHHHRRGLAALSAALLTAGLVSLLTGCGNWTCTDEMTVLAQTNDEHEKTYRTQMEILEGPACRHMSNLFAQPISAELAGRCQEVNRDFETLAAEHDLFADRVHALKISPSCPADKSKAELQLSKLKLRVARVSTDIARAQERWLNRHMGRD